jgi:hypothetical protein
MKMKHLMFVILAGSLFFASCTKYPEAADRLTEDLVVLTQYNTKADFSEYSTYSIPDSMVYYTDSDSGRIMNSNTALVINQIITNMNARGYTRVAPNLNPDLGFNVTFFQNTNVTVYYPGWYWGYPGYYPPDYWYGGYYGWGYYYPYYPAYVTTYSTGTVTIDVADFLNVDEINHKIPMVWDAYIRGLLTGYHTSGEITASIDQAFVQTPQFTK